MALAIRCAWRILPHMTGYSFLSFHNINIAKWRVPLDSFEQVLLLADDLTANRAVPYPFEWIEGYADFQSDATHDIPALAVFLSLLAAAKAALATTAAGQHSAADHAARSFSWVQWVVHTIPDQYMRYSDEHVRQVRTDYDLLHKIAIKQQWSDETPVPQEFFALHSQFEAQIEAGDRRIIEVGNLINEQLIAYFRRQPDHLYSLLPRDFEELIAELFSGLGYSVELTQRTRDGGRDVVAINDSVVKNKYLIECKRYKRDATVGVELVRQLHGVV